MKKTYSANALLVQAADLIGQAAEIHRDRTLHNIQSIQLSEALEIWLEMRDTLASVVGITKDVTKADATAKNIILPDRFRGEGLSTITSRAVQKRFTLNTRVSCSMPNKDAGKDWLRANGHQDIIQETVNAGTLNSFARAYEEDNGMSLPDELFRMSSMSYISATKVK